MLGPTLLDLFIPPATISATIMSDLIAVAIAGAVTGAVMVWILRQPASAPMKETGANRLIVTWISVWAISWGVSWAVGWSIVRAIMGSGYILVGGKVGGMIAGGIAGLVGGVGTALVLKLAKPSNGLKIYHLILIALGWAGIVYYDWLSGFLIAGLPVSSKQIRGRDPCTFEQPGKIRDGWSAERFNRRCPYGSYSLVVGSFPQLETTLCNSNWMGSRLCDWRLDSLDDRVSDRFELCKGPNLRD